MIRTLLIPLLAVCGVVFAAVTVVRGSKPPPATPPVIEPPSAPFETFVAGAGIIEPSSENVDIGTPVSGVVIRVAVVAGDTVKSGDVLFEIDHRELDAELRVRQAAERVAHDQLARLRALPRPEELPAAQARVVEAEAGLADVGSVLAMWERVSDPRAVAEDELSRRRYAVRTAEARLAAAQAELELLRAGAWASDVAIAQAQLESASAQVAAVRTEIDRRLVRAPMDCQVLQVNVRAGEFASAGQLTRPLMIVGAVQTLHVRADVDEHDAWRVRQGAKAVAFVRGNKALRTELTFVRFQPYVIPKRSLTGESTERVDTRVLQVMYAFPASALPVFVGQQMDVYIEAQPYASASASPSPGRPSAR